jgi:uncharacterized membrane protein
MAFCPNCGSPSEGRYCQKCGAALDPGATPGTTPLGASPGATSSTAVVGMSDNVAGALCYLFGLITGILFLVLAPYNQNRNIRFHAFQSIFLNVGWFVVWIAIAFVGIALHVIPILGAVIAGVLYFALSIGALILWLYMMFKTYNGAKVVLPVVGPMAEKQAGV